MNLQKKVSAQIHHTVNNVFHNPSHRNHNNSLWVDLLFSKRLMSKLTNVIPAISMLKSLTFMISLVSSVPLTALPAFSRPAPALQYLQIRRVESSAAAIENIPDNLFATVKDHGGPLLRVQTVEVGYGNSSLARMKGVVLPKSANISSIAFCNPSNFLEPCRPGQTIIGWVRYWKLDGNQSGNFSYQNRSLNSPWNTLSDSINIR